VLTCNQSDFETFVDTLKEILAREKLESQIYGLGLKLKS
jgi:hypothetical protein